jgi:hypothetical protein
MKRMRILGLCVVAVFAVTAFVGATSALALPEYADCISNQKTGKFKDSNCREKALTTEKANLKKFELKKVVPGEGATEESIGNEKVPLNHIKSTEIGTAHLETENATTIECKKSTSNSEILVKFSTTTGKQLPTKEVHNVVSIFTECTEAGKNSQNEGGTKGVIETTKVSGGLKGPLGYISGKGTKTPVIGQELKPTKAKGTFAEFECESIGKIKVGASPTGKLGDCIIGVVSGADTQSTKTELEFNGINGEFGREQKPQAFEGKTTHCNLETKLGEGPWERSVQVGLFEQESESPMQINAVP